MRPCCASADATNQSAPRANNSAGRLDRWRGAGPVERSEQSRLGEPAHRARRARRSARASRDPCCIRRRRRTSAATPANRGRATARARSFHADVAIDSCSVRVRGSCIASAESRSTSLPNRTRETLRTTERETRAACHASAVCSSSQIVRPPRAGHRARERHGRQPEFGDEIARVGPPSPGNHGAACAERAKGNRAR